MTASRHTILICIFNLIDIFKNCGNFTTGESCELCLPGYEGDPANPVPSRFVGVESQCNCDPRGSISGECYNGICQCKTNVEGNNCDRCRPGTFGLSSSNLHGCQACFCSGVATECRESNFYYEQITTFIAAEEHEFALTNQYQSQRIDDGFQINSLMNEIGYTFRPNNSERWYWSLPRAYTGNKIKSYGGQLEFTQRYTQRPQSVYVPDQDIIIIGNGVTIYWSNPQSQTPDVANKVSVVLSSIANWQRLDGNQGPRPATREDIMTVLANIDVILIRAQQSSDTESAYISDVTLDSAIEQRTLIPQPQAIEVEICRCPPGYGGSSCETCAPGYYRDTNEYSTGLLGSCSRCPCNSHEHSCNLGRDNRVVCNCSLGYTGRQCENYDSGNRSRPGENATGGTSNGVSLGYKTNERPYLPTYPPRPPAHNYEEKVTAPVGTSVELPCQVNNNDEPTSFFVTWTRTDNSSLPTDAFVRGGTLYIDNVQSSAEGQYCCVRTQQNTGRVVFSVTIYLEVISPPRITLVPPRLVVRPGDNAYIQCSATGQQPISISWLSVEGKLPQSVTTKDGLIQFNNIKLSDAGRYRCTATNSDGEAEDVAVVEVEENIRRPSLTAENRHQAAPVGSSITLRCRSQDANAIKNIRWFRERLPLPEHFRINGEYLHISNLQVQDQGRYNCEIPTHGGSSSDYIDLQVTYGNTSTPVPGPWQSTPAPVTMEITIIHPYLEIYKVGSSVRFNCTARSLVGRGPIRVQWTKDGSSLPSHAHDDGRGILVITNLRATDSGRYICEAYDGYVIESKDITVTVGQSQPEAPRVVITPPFVDIQEGQPIQIQCAATGNPGPVLRLIRLDGQQLNPSCYFENGLFRIEQARRSDQGPYQSIATNSAGTHTANVDIYVREVIDGGLTSVEISPPFHEGASGETFSLRCLADRAADIRWSRQNDQPIPYSFVAKGDTLTAHSPKPEDSGIYVCTATFSSGYTVSRTAEVRIHESTSSSPPTAKVTPERITISQGSSTELRCDATGSPTPTVKWTRVGSVASEFPPHITQSGSTLYIRNAQVIDRGLYVCVTSNSLGLTQASSIVEVNRFEIPTLSIHPSTSQTITAGNSAILVCRIEAGIPSPTLTWIRSDGRPLSSNIERMSDGTLRFKQITQNEAGEYICGAENEAGRASVFANIIVQVAPEVWTVPSEDLILRRRDEYIRLECHASGSPSPTVQWRRLEKTPRLLTSGLEGEAQSRNVAVLEIDRFSSQYQGLYICKARNEAGMAEKRIQLALESVPSGGGIVGEDTTGGTSNEVTPGYGTNERPYLPTYPPRPPVHNYDEEFTAPVGTTAELRCQVNNNDELEPMFVTWTRTDNSSLPTDAFVRGGTLYIDNVQPSAEGQYRCVRTQQNTGTVVFSVTAHLEVISPPRITLVPPRQVVRLGDNAYIQCSATGQQPISIGWLPVGRELPRSVTTQDGLIQFNNIQLSDAGRYRCTAINSAGEADAVADVTVEDSTILINELD